MQSSATQTWLQALGYTEAQEGLHVRGDKVDPAQPYAPELWELLNPQGAVRATAVFGVEGVPTVCFLEADAGDRGTWLDEARQAIWNQNLVTVVLLVSRDLAQPFPLAKPRGREIQPLPLTGAAPSSPFSMADIISGQAFRAHPDWFKAEERVDRELLANLQGTVQRLENAGLTTIEAQYLLGQILFISYLEHREIIGDVYRERRKVGSLHELIHARDTVGLARLFAQLKDDFNGDFLDPQAAGSLEWGELSAQVLSHLDNFLARVDVHTGHQAFWNYDFRYIPVELLSGIYETFLGEEKVSLGAYYTPRHLANFVVGQALGSVNQPAEATVYDGACGSGILLTTAFRRMLGLVEARDGSPLDLAGRIRFLIGHIFGSDLSEAACRVTAFSLYLSLLENILPRDIAALAEDSQVKLPTLLGGNIRAGAKEGDFFSGENPLASSGSRFSIFLSNPPWCEPEGKATDLSYEHWAEVNGRVLVRRQIAGAFAHQALECLQPDGVACLILPASLLLAPTSQRFIRSWLRQACLARIINFSDIRKLLFPKADHACAVVVARRRPDSDQPVIPIEEAIDYWVPKADVSLAFSRLTVYSNDRHRIFAQELWRDNALLRELYWGNAHDRSLLARLRTYGTLKDLETRSDSEWIFAKGFHTTDVSRPSQSPIALRGLPFLDARRISKDLPVLDSSDLQPFPDTITTVASLGARGGVTFKAGPKVLFPDGMSGLLESRAVFTDQALCFKHTVAAIAGASKDADLLRFLAVYLRSSLASYLLLHTAFSPASERERVTVKEIQNLPFCHLDDHPNPDAARRIVSEAASLIRELEKADTFERCRRLEDSRVRFNQLTCDYFELSPRERGIVDDAIRLVPPSRQPGSQSAATTPWQGIPGRQAIENYRETLLAELDRWRDVLGGKGSFKVRTAVTPLSLAGAWGIVQITAGTKGRRSTLAPLKEVDVRILRTLLDELRQEGLLPMPVSENLWFAADCLVLRGSDIFLMKPLVERLWHRGQAVEDAQQVVFRAQNSAVPTRGLA
jgi:hypothetical protein